MRRPWHVYGRWSMADEEQAHRSYATLARAMFRAIVWGESGMFDVKVWEQDEQGYLVGRVYRLDSVSARLTPKDPTHGGRYPADHDCRGGVPGDLYPL